MGRTEAAIRPAPLNVMVSTGRPMPPKALVMNGEVEGFQLYDMRATAAMARLPTLLLSSTSVASASP